MKYRSITYIICIFLVFIQPITRIAKAEDFDIPCIGESSNSGKKVGGFICLMGILGSPFSFGATTALCGGAMIVGAASDDQSKRCATKVKVFYATDRDYTSSHSPKEKYGINRSEMTYGTCDVNIPYKHDIGEIESPFWKQNEDPKKHFVLLNVDRKEKKIFFDELAARTRHLDNNDAFVFIHGYNSSFEDAAKRTAQIAYDLRFSGAPIFYSWHSKAEPEKYSADAESVRLTETNLKLFLKEIISKEDLDEIYVIAHSMGARALTRAFGELARENISGIQKVSEIILAAPDINVDIFREQIAPHFISSTHITLYASKNDKALELARRYNDSEPRLGDISEDYNEPYIFPGIESIDASLVDTTFFGHSYYGEKPVLQDICRLYRHNLRAHERVGKNGTLNEVKANGDKRYWRFKNMEELKGKICS
uniref:Esterase/lipase superfamily enzyme n=1 Tax=Candidatus Kentrum sp. MB TaxID=2138164 RepID=A0A450X1Y4_9GAMM|nr:MAG: Esterase/lipase superfamily enzyme [Candidatus Kentron sp. MB]VFK28391.1 MAG: Esterase/lipase superfamily enzyme [Candidatus Kentron sp. MB]VFK74229.1 MAG: Esterase/lipase superfamily enzyme [Candidatus Kentron sp. MB]